MYFIFQVADCLEEKSLKAPTEKGSVVYTQWISKLRRDIAAIRNHEATRFFTTCRNYLEVSMVSDPKVF